MFGVPRIGSGRGAGNECGVTWLEFRSCIFLNRWFLPSSLFPLPTCQTLMKTSPNRALKTGSSLRSIEPLEARIAPALLLGLDGNSRLLRFDSTAPGTVVAVSTTGLAPGEFLEGIDVRPADGRLYGLGILDGPQADDSVARLYRIEPTTGVATLVGSGAFASGLPDGLAYGIDFDPTSDVLRIVASNDLHIVVQPETGVGSMATAIDLSGGDEGLIEIAQGNNIAGATSSLAFGLDFVTGRLMAIGAAAGSADSGVLTVVGTLGIGLGSPGGGFDIAPNGTAFAGLTDAATGLTRLYTINLTTGAAASLGNIGDGATTLRGLTAYHHHWTGASPTTGRISDPANWQLGAAPGTGDVLVFADGPTDLLPFNDLNSAQFHSLRFTGDGYQLSGNAFSVQAGIVASAPDGVTQIFSAIGISPTASIQTSGTLVLSGPVFVSGGSGSVVVDGAGILRIDGDIIGASVGITKNGTGSLVLNGNNSYTAPTVVNGGLLVVNGNQGQGGVIVNAGELTGASNVLGDGAGAGRVQINSGTLSSFPEGGTLATAGLVLGSGSRFETFAAVRDGNLVSGGIQVTGEVSIGGAALQFELLQALPSGIRVPIIVNDGTDPIIGSFAGLPEGSIIMAGGVAHTLSYLGGDGNDLVLFRGAPLQVLQTNNKTVTFTDVDGDLVTVRTSKGEFSAANFLLQPSGILGGAQLQLVDLFAFEQLAGTTLTFTATPQDRNGDQIPDGDGQVHVGRIDARELDLAAVIIPGDLGGIFAGDFNVRTPGLGKLTVASLGRFGALTQAQDPTVRTVVLGAIQSVTVAGDLREASIETLTPSGMEALGNIGSLKIGGSILGGSFPGSGAILAAGSIGKVTLGGDLVGGSGEFSGVLAATGKIGNVTIGGAIFGGNGARSGLIQSIGALGVISAASLQGGSGDRSGQIVSDQKIAGIVISGDVRGFNGENSGTILTGGGDGAPGTIGYVKISGSLVGGGGDLSGRILALGAVPTITIGGDLQGRDGLGSGSISVSTSRMIQIGLGLQGGAGNSSGQIIGQTSLAGIRIGSAMEGGEGTQSGFIGSSTIGKLSVGSDILGGDGGFSGTINSTGAIASIIIGGGLIGGEGDDSGQIFAESLGSVTLNLSLIGGGGGGSGLIGSEQGINSVKISGNLSGGSGVSSGRIQAAAMLGSVTITGFLFGGSGNSAGSVQTDGTIGKLSIGLGISGGSALDSGQVFAVGSISAVQVGGPIFGGLGDFSGSILSNARLGLVTVAGHLTGGGGQLSGSIRGMDISSIEVKGSVFGLFGPSSGSITALQSIDKLRVHGALVGGSGPDSGQISAGDDLMTLDVGQGIFGGSGAGSGSVFAEGRLQKGNIAGIFGGDGSGSGGVYVDGVVAKLAVLGSVSSGNGTFSGSIISSTALVDVSIRGSVNGNASPLQISAPGNAATGNVAIGRLTIGGSVTNAVIAGGYDRGTFLNPAAIISSVEVRGDWVAGNIIAGVGSGGDELFGTSDDLAPSGGTARIASIIIGGTVTGTFPTISTTDRYGFVAREIGSLKVGGVAAPLQRGAFNDTTARPLGFSGDIVVREIA